MKIALLFPGITDVGFNSFGDGIDGSWHSHALMTLSACLKSQEFTDYIGAEFTKHDMFLIDLRRLMGWDDYRTRLMQERPDMICITMMSCDFNPSIKAARIAKEVLPKAHIIVGGVHPSIWPDEVLGRPEFDTVVLKEGEAAIVQLAEMVERGQELPHRIEGQSVNLDQMPFSDRSLFGPYEVPLSMPGFEPPFMTFIAGRGCIYNCSFCQPAERHVFGKKVRRRSPEHFVKEIILCRNLYGFKSALIHDDCLIEDVKWIRDFCHLIKENNCHFSFACQGRSDIVCNHPELIDELKSVGLRGMIVGFESGSDRILKFIRKGTTRKINIEAGRILKEKKVACWANYMLGLPTETREEMMETISMLKEIHPDHYSPAVYTPHPGSDLFDYCLKNDLLLNMSHDSFRRNVTEIKIKGQSWHEIQWAVGESVKPDGQCIPYTTDYTSHWGDLENLLSPLRTEASFKFQDGMPLQISSVENLVNESTLARYTSTTTDPQIIFNFKEPLVPKNWGYVFVDIELSASSRGQFVWWANRFKLFQATRHFRIPYGRHTFVFDLSKFKTYQSQIGDNIAWNDYPVDRLRFDPAESEGVAVVLHRAWLLPAQIK